MGMGDGGLGIGGGRGIGDGDGGGRGEAYLGPDAGGGLLLRGVGGHCWGVVRLGGWGIWSMRVGGLERGFYALGWLEEEK